MGRYSGKKCRLLTMIGLTTSFFIIELVVGYVTNSMALVADSFHMLSDVVSIIIAFLSVKVIFCHIHETMVSLIIFLHSRWLDVSQKMEQKHFWLG